METVGDALRALRRERRIKSQQELAELSGVSQSTIKLIEAGQSEPKPSTLRMLAQGLASDFDGQVDATALEAIYARLVKAAGIWPQAPESGEQDMTREEWLEQTARRLGRADLAVAMSTVAWDYDRIPKAHQRVIEAALLALIENGPEEDRARKRR